jgi:arabinofuranan 3-O-arabinosyltransferase
MSSKQMSDEPIDRRLPVAPQRNAAGPAAAARRSQKFLAIEDRAFTEWRIQFYGSGVAIAWALVMAWLLVHSHWIIHPDGTLASLDFCFAWISGKFAALGEAPLIFGHGAMLAAHDIFFRANECALPPVYDYPPTALFLFYPLGFIPYLVAFPSWVGATLLLYEAAVYKIIPRLAAIVSALAPMPVLLNALDGFNGFVTAGLMGLSLGFLQRRPWLSGMFLGLLTYKPQFGVLFPLALVVSQNWRVFGSATITSVTLGAAATVAFGYQGWPSFIASVFDRDADFSLNEVYLRLQSSHGLLLWVGASVWLSSTVQLVVALVVTTIVCVIWAKPIPYALKAATLSIGSVTVTPYVLAYDLPILSIAAAFLVKDGLVRGFIPGERTAILLSCAALFLLTTWTPPVTPLVCAVLLFLAVRRIPTLRVDGVVRSDPLERTAVLRAVLKNLSPGSFVARWTARFGAAANPTSDLAATDAESAAESGTLAAHE